MNQSDRNAAILRYKDIRTARRLMSALSSDLKDYNRNKSSTLNSIIGNLKNRLNSMRQVQRDRSGDTLQSPRSFSRLAEDKIRKTLTDLVARRKFKTTIIIGGADTGTCEYRTRNSNAEVTLCVGHMWYRNVYENIYKDHRLAQNEYIILSAVEYRTNVPHIRLYEATAYGTTEKKQMNGWIGQSKLGNQLCAFRTDKMLAIQAAQRLTLASVNKQLIGETTNG